jgi:hypothetical protein
MADELGPSSERMNSGAPRRLNWRASMSTVRLVRIAPTAPMTRDSRVYSSMTVKHLIYWPLTVVSNTKS